MLRFAEEKDIPALLDLCENYYTKLPYPDPSDIDLNKADQLFRALIEGKKEDSIVLLSVNKKEEIIGVLVGAKYYQAHSFIPYATELLYFVTGKSMVHRKALVQLYQAYEYWARKVGCQVLRIGALSDHKPRVMSRFYKRHGMKKVEEVYMKEL